jgi:hypothetical protein
MKKLSFLTAAMAITFVFTSCENDVALENVNSQKKTATIQKVKADEVIYVDNVNKEIAEIVAKTFFTSIEGSPIEFTVSELDSLMDWEGKTAMYVFNLKPTGFVITSADVRNDPIIAYSQEENFILTEEDGLPEALKNRLMETIIGNKWQQDGYKGWDKDEEVLQNMLHDNVESWFALQKQESQESNFAFQLNPKSMVKLFPSLHPPFMPCCDNELVGETTVTYGYYCQTIWGQGEPYNYFIDNYYPTGCTAVATAQVMKFHNYPTYFNWTAMPNACTSSNTTNPLPAGEWYVAMLMCIIGIDINTNYSSDGSSSNLSNVRKALVNTYGYSSSANIANWNYNSIVSEIKNQKHPIIARGDGTTWSWRWWLIWWHTVHEYEDGHAYVIDGYREHTLKYYNECQQTYSYITTKFLHYNFGWNGSYNDWFSSSISDIVDTYIDKDGITGQYFPNFQYNKKCIYNIKPK